MTWIKTVAVDEAVGRLARSYQAALKRAGRVFGIVRAMSLHPPVLDSSMGLYRAIMHDGPFGPEDLSRVERELVATVVSQVNHCHY